MTQNARTDEELVAALRAGDDAAFTAIVRRYEAPLIGFARGFLGGAHHDAEECVQDAFVRALRALRADDRPIALRAWLHTIVRNRCLDQLRRADRTSDLEAHAGVLADPAGGPISTIMRREALHRMVGELQELPERQRAALLLHELEDRSHSQIGRLLGVSKGASKALVHRARRGLGGAAPA